MKYETWLKNKNLAKNTINIYLKNYEIWNNFITNKKVNKTLFTKFINDYSKNHKPKSIHLMYSSILSIFRYQKKWKLINELKDIRLPKEEITLKSTIDINIYKKISKEIELKSWHEKRDWLIVSFLLLTGIRASELLKINKKDICFNKLLINGKGNKFRTIYLNDYLIQLLNSWKANRIAISKSNDILTIKQINIIVKKNTTKYFNKTLTSHGLRRSYATNLIKSNVNLEIIRKTLGHSSITTTSRYIQYTEDEILNEIEKVMK